MSPAKADPKKRKVSGGAAATSASAAPPAPKVSKLSVYDDTRALEEKQSRARTAEIDTDLYASTCAQLKNYLDQILRVKLDLKRNSSKGAPSKEVGQKAQREISELRIKFSLSFMNLKKLNRLDKIRTKRIREVTSNAMQKVDSFHLQLQNLRYEVLHLEKEVAKCLQFRSRDEHIDLVPAEEFYSSAPAELKVKLEDADGEGKEHRERLVRLEYENLQRKAMFEEQEKLDKEKQGFEEKIKEKRTSLASLKPQLAAILKQTKSVQEYLNLPLDEERDQYNLSNYLPPALFILYTEVKGYGDACDKNLKVQIVGDLEEAKTTNAASRMETTEDDEDEEEVPTEEDDERRAKGKDKKEELKKSKEDKIRKMFAVHPLSVECHLKLGNENALDLSFSFLTNLRIIVVKVSVFVKDAKTLTNREVMGNSSLLSHLLNEDDPGTLSPDPATNYILNKVTGLEKFPNEQLAKVGAAFKWAQDLGGIRFPDVPADLSEINVDGRPLPTCDRKYCRTKVEQILKSIKERFNARFVLQQQISVLDKGSGLSHADLPIPGDFIDEFSGQTHAKIQAWYPVSWEQYRSLELTHHFVSHGAVKSNDFLFRMQINRDPASLVALIAMGPDYPRSPPVFCLNLHWNGEYNINNCEKMRVLEYEINSCYSHLITDGLKKKQPNPAHYILSLQIRKLIYCLDVLLESWNSSTSGKIDFPREEVFLQPVRGRSRAPPLKYEKQLKMFTQ